MKAQKITSPLFLFQLAPYEASSTTRSCPPFFSDTKPTAFPLFSTQSVQHLIRAFGADGLRKKIIAPPPVATGMHAKRSPREKSASSDEMRVRFVRRGRWVVCLNPHVGLGGKSRVTPLATASATAKCDSKGMGLWAFRRIRHPIAAVSRPLAAVPSLAGTSQ